MRLELSSLRFWVSVAASTQELPAAANASMNAAANKTSNRSTSLAELTALVVHEQYGTRPRRELVAGRGAVFGSGAAVIVDEAAVGRHGAVERCRAAAIGGNAVRRCNAAVGGNTVRLRD